MSDLGERIVLALTGSQPSEIIAPVLADVRAEQDRLSAEHERLEKDALDPLTPAATVAERRAQCAEIDFQAKRLVQAIERLTAAHDAAKEREALADRRAKFQASQVELLAAGLALEGEGKAIAARLRAMIQRGNEAWKAALEANRNLPEGSKPISRHPLCGRVPERIVNVRDMRAWFCGHEHISEDRVGEHPPGATEAFIKGANGLRCSLEPARRIETVPAHDVDWLGNAAAPAPVVRIERVIPERVAPAVVHSGFSRISSAEEKKANAEARWERSKERARAEEAGRRQTLVQG